MTVACRRGATTFWVLVCPVEEMRRTTYLRRALPSLTGWSHAMVRRPSPRSTIRTPVTARGSVSGRTAALGADGSPSPTPLTAATVNV